MISLDNIQQHPFVQLIQIALGKKKVLDRPLTESEWTEVMVLARQQSMPGICFQGMMALPEEQLPTKKNKIQLAYVSELIAKRNQIMIDRAAETTKMMQRLGLRSCVLKGQGVAMFYPDPLLRSCGDIDLWVDGNYRKVLKRIRKKWATGPVFYHHTEIKPFPDDTIIEIHFRPSWMNQFSANRKLQNYFDTHKEAQFSNFQKTTGFSKPTAAFDCVYCAVHIYRHLLQEGIGMRQLMDYYYILINSSKEDRNEARDFLCSLGMEKFLGALMYVEKKLFLLEDGNLLCPIDEDLGKFLLSEILQAGNFGIFDRRLQKGRKHNIFTRMKSHATRLSHFSAMASKEVMWAPAFKIWQYFWRMLIPRAFAKM